MKAISYNMGEWTVVSDHLTVEKGLPPLTYTVRYKEEKGFFLKEEPNLTVNEKMYGKMVKNINIMIESFKANNRSMGCIFSGDKGLGKSMAMRYLASKMNELKYPIIIVDKYYPGIARFLMTISCDAVVIFDEFDKTFGPTINNNDLNSRNNDPNFDKQNELLSLFDGLSSNRFFFVITCNYLYNVSDFLLDRPGRFHYHVKFGYPTRSEVTEYLMDNLKPEYQNNITAIANFCDANQVNYDGIRSIVFELNMGRDFESVIKILNIDQNKLLKFNIKVRTSNKMEFSGTLTIGGASRRPTYYYNRYSHNGKLNRVFLDTKNGKKTIEVLIPDGAIEYNEKKEAYVIKKGDNITLCDWYDANGEVISDDENLKDAKITHVELELDRSAN